MAKICVEIFTPGNGKSYEFTMDSGVKIGELLERLPAQIEEFEAGNIAFDKAMLLLCAEESGPLDPGQSLPEAGVKNGQRLILL
jgi:hypothetical protein